MSLAVLSEAECTAKCRSLSHAAKVLSAITVCRDAEDDLMAYLKWLCCNFDHTMDALGRTALHLASSCGEHKIVRWLVEKRGYSDGNSNNRDWESGWTSLHRSLFYGHLNVAKILLENGASLGTLDHDFLSPLDLVIKDRPPHVNFRSAGLYEVYVWGQNSNFNLGLSTDQSRPLPELIDSLRKVSVVKIVMCKFHTVFLSNCGKVFTCGHGQGGRLGNSVEKTVLTPQIVRAVSKDSCVDIAAGNDHTIVLTEAGNVFTFGDNRYHQLGHVPPPNKLTVPKMVTGFKERLSKGKKVVGVAAARYHSVIHTHDSVFTFGLNAGQLGHFEKTADQFQTAPRLVTEITDVRFSHIVACDGATICASEKGDIYALHQYQCRKIASKQFDIIRLAASGGRLDTSRDVPKDEDGGGSELRVVFLTKSGRISVWCESNPVLTRCFLSIQRPLIILDMALYNAGLLLVTEDGEVFSGVFLTPKSKPVVSRRPEEINVNRSVSSFAVWVEKDECFQLRVKRVSNVHRAAYVACDIKGRNFAVLQMHPKSCLLETPEVGCSQMTRQLNELLRMADICDDVHDAVLKVGQREVPVHRYILASRSEFFRSQFTDNPESSQIIAPNINPAVVDLVLEFLYTDSLEFSSDKNVNAGTVRLLQDAATKLELHSLKKRLEKAKISSGKIQLDSSFARRCANFDRSKFPEFYDVIMKPEDGLEIKCHKCILVARSDYFGSMLTSNWMETSSCSSLKLPFPRSILEVIVDSLYTDRAAKLDDCEDVDYLCDVLVASDSLLIARIKEFCEIRLADLLTLKNAAELLEFSVIYNADQLKATCMQYIGLNLAAFLESKSLSILSDEVLLDLSRSYRNLIPQMSYRVITPYSDGPSLDEIHIVAKSFPLAEFDDEIGDKPSTKEFATKKVKSKRKSQTRKSIGSCENATPKDDSSELFVSNNGDVNEAKLDDDLKSLVSSPIDIIPLSSSLPERNAPQSFSWLQGAEDMNSAFPDLISNVAHPVMAKTSAAATPSTKTSKLSQKQRKKLAAERVLSAPVPIPHSTFADKVSKTNAWGASNLNTLSLKDIMHSEERDCARSLDQKFPNSPPSVSSSPLSPKTVWADVNRQLSSSSSSSHQLDKSMSGAETSFTDIVKAEQEQLNYLSRQNTKSLHLIQKEDEAIEQLLVYYSAKDNPEEKITVERILPQFTATPVWKLK